MIADFDKYHGFIGPEVHVNNTNLIPTHSSFKCINNFEYYTINA